MLGVVAGSPPANHMARYGLIGKAKPYQLVVDRRYDSPTVNMLNDLDAGEIAAQFAAFAQESAREAGVRCDTHRKTASALWPRPSVMPRLRKASH